MVRSLALAVALALGTVSIPAHALGLGDINSKSALNQHFDADIDLLSVASGELEAVRVRLATQEAFDRAGIERPFFLTLLKFRPELLQSGKAVIRVSSDFPINEPFLNFLVEVNWPRGKLVREYTVLLDPPTTTKRRAPKVSAAPASVEVSRPSQTQKQALPPQQVGEGEYGPIASGETLWSIARGLRPSGVSMSQMMIALQRANPQAFINGNINKLREGQILRVPGTEEILSISRQDAQSSYRQQQDDWLTQRADKLQEAAAKTPAEDGALAGSDAKDKDAELRLATPRPEGDGKAGTGEDRGDQELDNIEQQLLVARENAETSRLENEGLRSEIDDLEKRLQDMQRLLSLKDEQLAQLQDNVAQGGVVLPEGAEDPLEAALRDAQEAVEQSGTPLEEPAAAADKVAEEANVKDLTTPATPDQDVVSKEPAKQAEPAESEVKYPIMRSASIKEAQPVVADTAQVMPAPEAEVKYPIMRSASIRADDDTTITEAAALQAEPVVAEPQTAAEPEGGPAPAEEVAAKPEAPEVTQTPQEEAAQPARESGGGVISEYWPWLAGVGGLLVILLLLLLGRRDSKSKEAADREGDESILLEEDGTSLETDAVDESATVGSDTSFLSEFSPSDINALRDDTGEVDAVSEADVYIAYGRYQQAEDLLRQGLERDPERLALKHKLLEVFYATRNKDAFVSLAQELHETGQDMADEEAWVRAKDMGRELDEGNALFAATESGVSADDLAAIAEPAADAASDSAGSANFDEFELDSLVSELNTPEGSVDEPSDLSLEDFDKDLEKALEEDSVIADDLESLEIDLPDFDTQELDNAGQAPGLEEVRGGAADDSMLDIESDLQKDDLQAQLDEFSELKEGEGGVSEMTEDAGEKPLVPDDGLSASVDPVSEDALDKPLSLDEAFASDSLDDAQGVAELDEATNAEDQDGVETKLDLARAYVEMGDSEGARNILEEVQKEGNDSQKEEAVRLLSEIG